MDVADQFQQVGIFFADNGFITILEEMAASFVAFIECNGVASHEPAHYFAERCRAGSQEEMKMVWDQGPGIALGLGFFEDICQAIEEGVAVLVVSEDLSSFDSSSHYML